MFVEFVCVCKLGVVFVINMLYFDIDVFVVSIDWLVDVIGLYFFLLVNVMKLFEIVVLVCVSLDVVVIVFVLVW